tara:strand:- start:1310 stop:2095 length:786 start_codon:yes stop_codon:yes gene_type:complete
MTENSKILIIGATSGLGKFLATKLKNCYVFNRNSKIKDFKNIKFKYVIHCANNPANDISLNTLNQFSYDNFFLNQLILDLKFDRLVFISSIGIYPSDKKRVWKESDDFIIKTRNYYEFFKLVSEKFFISKIKNTTIIRSGGLLGAEMRENSLTRILQNLKVKLSLSSKSVFNYILYEDILSFIKIVIKKKKIGIFNVCASENSSLEEVKKKYKSFNISFGNYNYFTPRIDNSLARSELSILNNTTQQNIARYIKKLNLKVF